MIFVVTLGNGEDEEEDMELEGEDKEEDGELQGGGLDRTDTGA